MTCKDCIHWKACRKTAYEYTGEDAASAYGEDNCCKAFAEICENFSDKSEWLHLLGKDYKTTSSNANSRFDSLQLIHDLCVDYDGFNTVDGLKSLIDDIRAITEETLK